MNESPAARLQATLNLNPAEELRQLLDFTPELIAVLGPNRERLYANRLALAYLGASLEEWQARSLDNDVHPDDLERLEAHLVRSLSSGAASDLCTDIDERKRAEERLQRENVALREEIDQTSMFEEIVGASPALTAVL